jgi:hypothetical protein
MSTRAITHEEAKEVYNVAVLRQHESNLARCYVELYRAARRVCSTDSSGCGQESAAAIEMLRKVVS